MRESQISWVVPSRASVPGRDDVMLQSLPTPCIPVDGWRSNKKEKKKYLNILTPQS